jgi:two-component system, NtrC family, nitrogen regulation sensor histidine kinase NtrY
MSKSESNQEGWRLRNLFLPLLYGISGILVGAPALTAVSGFGPVGIASNITFWALIAGSALLLLVAGILAARVWRTIQAGRRRGNPARLHVRFITIFSLAAVVPVILVAGFLTVAFSRGVEQWFGNRVSTVMNTVVNVASSNVSEMQNAIVGDVLAMAKDLNANESRFREERATFNRYLVDQAIFRDFAAVYLIDGRGNILARAESDSAPPFEAPTAADLSASKDNQVLLNQREASDLTWAMYRLRDYEDASLYVVRKFANGMLSQLLGAQTALNDYRGAEARSGQLRFAFGLAYAAVAAWVLLGTIWFAQVSASRLAVPISRLSQAARRVGEGDWSTRVPEARRNDEIGALGDAFNRMTATLEAQRRALVGAREEAEKRSRFIETVLSEVSAGVIGVDQRDQVTAANPSAANLLGRPVGSLLGQRIGDVSPGLLAIVSDIRESPGADTDHQVELDGPSGKLILRVRGGLGPDGVVLTFDDVTRLIAAQRQAAWRDVARRIAHEIKNPLTPIQLSAERLQRRFKPQINEDPETFEQCTATILRQVSDIGRMVDEFSAFARMPTPQFADVDLNSLALEAVQAQRIAFPNIDFEIVPIAHDASARGDDRLIVQALTNVIKNAAEAVSQSQERDGEPERGKVEVSIRQSDELVAIEVSDNGPGYPQQDRMRLLEPYVTTRTRGTGLGLAIVSRVLEDHGGRVELADAPPPLGGALTRLCFPLPDTETVPMESRV